MKGLTLTVSQLNEYVRRSLASDPMLRGLCLTGELSNFKRHTSGHWYFTLKDEEAAINCAMFRQSAMGVRFRPENGQRVRLFGSVGLYARTGSYQFYAEAMEPDGVGELYLRFEALKRKLEAEGLFDASLKKPLPLLPRGVGIVTSKTGAVVHDIARVSWRRYPGMPLYLCPVKVQGEGAAAEIASAIRLLDGFAQAEVIIVGRGGGSMEDLWAFNEEIVARAIARCRKPVISAVGHETDVTIADFVADVRAPTPSAAAELAVPEREALAETMRALARRLERACVLQLSQKQLRLAGVCKRLEACSPASARERASARVTAARAAMTAAMQRALLRREHALRPASLRLSAAGPVQTMRRGYAVVLRKGRAVRSAEALVPGDALKIVLAQGKADALVTGVEKG
mgnify:CR=1 FL=1